ncbi:MAG: hypothetical protein LBO07_01815 [Coriobacteriales bacterium]|jgi:hypothetical protein|nr:hypothetical protein [Coriobacteriales bacterium]
MTSKKTVLWLCSIFAAVAFAWLALVMGLNDIPLRYGLLGFQHTSVVDGESIYVPSDWIISRSKSEQMLVMGSREFSLSGDELADTAFSEIYFGTQPPLNLAIEGESLSQTMLLGEFAYRRSTYERIYSDGIRLQDIEFVNLESDALLSYKQLGIPHDKQPLTYTNLFSINESISTEMLDLIGRSFRFSKP